MKQLKYIIWNKLLELACYSLGTTTPSNNSNNNYNSNDIQFLKSPIHLRGRRSNTKEGHSGSD